MGLSLDKALSIYPQTLALRTKRAEILANNIANEDTPGYKARDLDFSQVLKNTTHQGISPARPMTTHAGHKIGLLQTDSMEGLKYRLPHQPAIDGNTVDGEKEKAEYAQNSLRFQASFQFLNSAVKGIIGALRGE